MLTEFQQNVAIENYKRWLRFAVRAWEEIVKHGHADLLDKVFRARLDPEDIAIKYQEVIVKNLSHEKHINQLQKMYYHLATQNCPSTGQPMSKEEFYDKMGWIEHPK
jgi:hypothetical protein